MYTREILKLAQRMPVITPKIVSIALNIDIRTVRRILIHLYATKRIRRICKGYYTLYTNEKTIGTFLNYPSYISFVSALSHYGITTQIPPKITFASLKRWRAKKCVNHLGIEYIKIPKRMFYGYKKANEQYFIALPEKAIIDMILVNMNPQLIPIDWKKIDGNLLIKLAKPNKKILDKVVAMLYLTNKKE